MFLRCPEGVMKHAMTHFSAVLDQLIRFWTERHCNTYRCKFCIGRYQYIANAVRHENSEAHWHAKRVGLQAFHSLPASEGPTSSSPPSSPTAYASGSHMSLAPPLPPSHPHMIWLCRSSHPFLRVKARLLTVQPDWLLSMTVGSTASKYRMCC